jgi:putative FmdB family regulatory protein
MVCRPLPPCRYNRHSGSFLSEGLRTLPLYAYRCTQCGHVFEKIQHYSAEPEVECRECHGLLERPVTAPGLRFKGAGWYVNDYAPKSSTPAAPAGSETSSKSEGGADKAETKTPATTTGDSAGAATPAPAPSTTAGSSTPASST